MLILMIGAVLWLLSYLDVAMRLGGQSVQPKMNAIIDGEDLGGPFAYRERNDINYSMTCFGM